MLHTINSHLYGHPVNPLHDHHIPKCHLWNPFNTIHDYHITKSHLWNLFNTIHHHDVYIRFSCNCITFWSLFGSALLCLCNHLLFCIHLSFHPSALPSVLLSVNFGGTNLDGKTWEHTWPVDTLGDWLLLILKVCHSDLQEDHQRS